MYVASDIFGEHIFESLPERKLSKHDSSRGWWISRSGSCSLPNGAIKAMYDADLLIIDKGLNFLDFRDMNWGDNPIPTKL